MRLLVDAMLGRLARYLRMCGHDAAYAPDRGVEADEAILALADAESRRILTRDTALAAEQPDAVLLTATDIEGQLDEVRAAGIDLAVTRPSRCGRCNGELVPVAADEETPEYAPAPDTRTVWRCVDCGQHFWRGSHWADVKARLAEE